MLPFSPSFIKVDNCAQYAYGNSRFFAMADAANRTGRPLVISTEPFSLVPTPLQGEFSHMYRTTNDVEGSYSSNLSEFAGEKKSAFPGNKSTTPPCVLLQTAWTSTQTGGAWWAPGAGPTLTASCAVTLASDLSLRPSAALCLLFLR